MVEVPRNNPFISDPDLGFDEPEELTDDEAREQVEALREAIEYHDYRYYVENDPIISDTAYDALFDRLRTLENEFDLVDENSPTQRVGGEPMEVLETRDHVTEMLSLASSEDEADVCDFVERVRDTVGAVEYSVEPKFDGISTEFVYEDGEFDRAVTRGDGRRGDDVSANVRTIRSVPLRLRNAPELLAVQGEIYMPKSGFHDLNEQRVQEGKDPFATPRNAAAGTVRQLDPNVAAERPLDVYFYDVLECSQPVEAQSDAFELLASLGLRVNEYNRIVDDVDAIVAYRDAMLDRRDDLDYDIDGVVAKVNDFDVRDELGSTARHPQWAFAYKFPAKAEETIVRRIVVQVGRTGKLTPVALLDPVDVRGVTISRATLHNERRARELGIAEGATVKVERAGDVIPEVIEVIESPDGAFEMPDWCPVCGGSVEKQGENHYCTGGLSCRAQLRRALQHFCSTEAMDIKGVGEEVADELVESGLVASVADLYDLEKDDLVSLNSFGEKSAANLLAEIEDSKRSDLANLIYALGIRGVGKERTRVLASHFTLAELREANESELEAVSDIGPEVAASIRTFFENEHNAETLDRLQEAGVRPDRTETETEFDE